MALSFALLFNSSPLLGPVPKAHAAIGKDPIYGKVPGLNEHSRVMIWYGTNTATQAQLNTLKTYDLVILEPTIRIVNVAKNQFYFETFTPNQVNEVKRGIDGILGTADDVIVLAYISVGELATSSVFTGFTGNMTIQNGKDVGLLPTDYSGPSGPLHGPNPWNYSASGSYIDVEGGASPDGTYDSGFNGYDGISIADDYSSTGPFLRWGNKGLMPWYLDQQGTWVNDSRYMYGGYWKNGDGTVDTNNTYGGGYINGGDPTWKKLITFMTDKLEHDAGYDGVFLDTVDTPDPVGGAGPTTSWGPRGNFGFTAKGMVELVEAVKAVDPAKVVAANRGYWYFNPDEGTSQFASRYRHAINIFLTESWYHNPYITSGSKFYDENPAFADNWNTNPASPTYRNRDNFGGFWKEYMNAQANQPDGFNIIICDFTVPAAGMNKWMNEVVTNSRYMGYNVSGATHFSNMYGDSKNWLDAKGFPSSSLAGAHPTDLHGGFNIDGDFSDWANETPIYSDPAGNNGKGITKVYAKFAGGKFFMKIDAKAALNLQSEMIYFDYDKKGPAGWQGVAWPITPDSRIYFENQNKVYLAPHVSGQGDVFKFPTTTVSNNGWPVEAKQAGTSAELSFDADYIFPASLAGQEIRMWFRVANFGGEAVKFFVPGTPAVPAAPSGLTAAPGDGQIKLSWSANAESNLAGYNVYLNGTKANAALLTGTSYTVTGLSNGTAYSFQVTAVNTNGSESPKSAAVSATPQPSGGPPGESAIIVDGNVSDWSSVAALNAGPGGTVTTLKATNDDTNLYLLIQGSGLNAKSQFYLNTDNNMASGYHPTGWGAGGIDTLLENQSLYAYGGTNNSWVWTPASNLGTDQFVRDDSVLEAAIPLSSLGIASGSTIRIGFIANDSATNRLPANNGVPFSFTLQ